jgi:hypothetical protein
LRSLSTVGATTERMTHVAAEQMKMQRATVLFMTAPESHRYVSLPT